MPRYSSPKSQEHYCLTLHQLLFITLTLLFSGCAQRPGVASFSSDDKRFFFEHVELYTGRVPGTGRLFCALASPLRRENFSRRSSSELPLDEFLLTFESLSTNDRLLDLVGRTVQITALLVIREDGEFREAGLVGDDKILCDLPVFIIAAEKGRISGRFSGNAIWTSTQSPPRIVAIQDGRFDAPLSPRSPIWTASSVTN